MPRSLVTSALSATALSAALAPGAAGATTWGEFFSLYGPDQVAQRLFQLALVSTRTVTELSYSDLSVDVAAGQISLQDIDMWPYVEWSDGYDCHVQIDRVTLRTAPPDSPETIRMSAQAAGVTATPECLPPSARPMVVGLGFGDITVPRLTIDGVYDMPSSGADLHIFAELSEGFAVDATTELDYIWFSPPRSYGMDDSMDYQYQPNVEPVMFLRGIELTVEDLGGLDKLSPMFPPAFTDPDTAGAAISGMLTSMLEDMNAQAAAPAVPEEPFDPFEDPYSDEDPFASPDGMPPAPEDEGQLLPPGAEAPQDDDAAPEGPDDMADDIPEEPAAPSPEEIALTPEQEAFVASAAEAWPAFVGDGRRLTVGARSTHDYGTFIDVTGDSIDTAFLFADLTPTVSTAPRVARNAVPAELLSRAIEGDADTLSEEDRRRVGMAVLTGDGAPRSVERGVALLSGLAEAGDGAAALALAQALRDTDAQAAYRWALLAGAADAHGAAAQLDRMEAELGFDSVLELQQQAAGDPEAQTEGVDLTSVAALRDAAFARLSGRGAVRSYPMAVYWASLAKAAGDREAADVLDQIDARVRRADPQAQARWQEAEAEAADRALQAWIDGDLPAEFGGR
ncbi:hypothetical protein EKE94_09060 [Mesobaculum littorinae]|uniref:Sel1 repeat family protein n=1 Tax=Mesobaculum littorinae TaxID=2486419 RepID=A0A438AJP9_9RHOB|nr:hypothetical protein [Mesobaculum littorinae]RVV99013.1 hypothetical protein EKE94_09060 [Mesobaculum littorinae]